MQLDLLIVVRKKYFYIRVKFVNNRERETHVRRSDLFFE